MIESIQSFIKSLTELIKLKSHHFAIIFLISSILLFAPDWLINKWDIQNLRNQYRSWLGIALIVSFAFLFVDCFKYLWEGLWKKLLQNKVLKRLKSLSLKEKEILNQCISTNSQTFFAMITDCAPHALCQKGIAVDAPSVNMIDHPFTIQDFVWNYIKKHPEILD